MISREQAQQAAREWALASLPAGGGAVSLWEFDLGYVVGHVPPPREPGAPPTLLGAPRAVVDKETGEVTVWPSIAWEEVAQRYTADRAARRRFPEEVRAALGAAGWLPGRDVTARVEVWLEKFHADFPEARSALPLFPVAAAALAEFGGLRPRGHTPEGRPVEVGLWPRMPRTVVAAYAAFAADLGQPVFPFAGYPDAPESEDPDGAGTGAGAAAGGGDAVLGADGRVFLLRADGLYLVGRTVDEAVTALIRGPALVPVDEHGQPLD